MRAAFPVPARMTAGSSRAHCRGHRRRYRSHAGKRERFHGFVLKYRRVSRCRCVRASGLAAKHGVMVLIPQAPSTRLPWRSQSHPHQPRKRTHHCPPRRPHRAGRAHAGGLAVDFKEKTGISETGGSRRFRAYGGVKLKMTGKFFILSLLPNPYTANLFLSIKEK